MKLFLPAALSGSLLALAACHSNPPEPTFDPAQAAVPGFVLPTNAASGATLSFQNTSQRAVAYRWNFGDGSSPDRTQSPTHTYAKAGTYQVVLRAYGAQKDSVDVTQSLTVAGLPDGLVGRYFGRIYRVNSQLGFPTTYTSDTLTLTVSRVDAANVLVFGDKLTSVANTAANPLVSYATWDGHQPSRPYYSFGYTEGFHYVTKLQRETAGDSVYLYRTGGGLSYSSIAQFYGKKR